MRGIIKELAGVAVLMLLLAGCAAPNGPAGTLQPHQSAAGATPPTPAIQNTPNAPDNGAAATPPPTETPYAFYNETGTTIATRINPPEGYTRTQGNAYEEFIRNQELMPHGSPVLLYDGSEKRNQSVHAAVLSIDVGERDRQQCADAALRLRCEFLFSTGQYDRINYHLTNGDEFPYTKYRDGYRLKVEGNDASLIRSEGADDSYTAFRKYCDILFAYAGTISVEKESAAISKEEMRIGDIFVQGGSPGHCVIVMDMCENAGGDRLFLLGQSYMPAQQIHILKNPAADSPWYSVAELSYPFSTPEWTFDAECLMRMP